MTDGQSASITVPSTMTAVRIYEYGGPDVLKVEQHPVPKPKPNQILIHVKATSISGWDLLYRNGSIKPIPGRPPNPMPQQLGREAVGYVVQIGEDVGKFRVGDKAVMLASPACGQCTMCAKLQSNLCIQTSLPAHSTFGAYAEYIVVGEDAALKAAETADCEKLASLMWSYGTVHHFLRGQLDLKMGESLLITGASGGMGTSAIQLAKLAGAYPIIALTSVVAKRESLTAAGADYVLDYKDPDIAEQIRASTSDRMGVDAVLDNVGGKMATMALDVVRLGGRIGMTASIDGAVIDLDIQKIIVKNISIFGARGSRLYDQRVVLNMLNAGKIDPIISHRFPLTRVVDATREMESGAHTGKIVLYTE